MSAIVRWCMKLFLFWVGFFLLQQTVFLAFNAGRLHPIPWPEILLAYRYALPMDLAAAGYVMLIPSLLVCMLQWSDRPWLRRAISGYMVFAVLLCALVNVIDLGLFQAWGSLLNRKALSYLAFPDEAGAAVAGTPWFKLTVLLTVQAMIGWWAVRRMKAPTPIPRPALWRGVTATVLLPGLFFMAARGGPQDDPINKSWSYYSVHPVLNLSALNGLWNLFEMAVMPADITANPYLYFTKEEAHTMVRALTAPGTGSSERIFTVEKPDIVLILLESWSGDIIAPLGGETDVTPHFTALCDSGLLFANFYSTGFRTEQGLCAIVSGFPSQPTTTIVRNYGKFDRLPSMINALDSNGYNSRWYYTGSVVFANTRSYLDAMGFDVVHSEEDMPGTKRTEWGAYDEELFGMYLADSGTFHEPFFHAIMTATSHEPFDAPVRGGFPGKGEAQLYRNTVAYTDSCLGDFFHRARALSTWKNTIYIVVADHGHYLPKNRNSHDLERHRIACLITGGALRSDLRGTRNATFTSHVDLAATIMGQLALPHDRFAWSKDIFDPATSKFAWYSFDNGFGYADADQAVVFDAIRGKPILWRDSTATAVIDSAALRNGKVLLQVELDRYLELDQ